MSDSNVIFNNSSQDDESIDEGEFKIGEEETTEYSFGDEVKEKSVEDYNGEIEEKTTDEEAEEIDEEETDEEENEAENKEDSIVISKSKVVLIEKLLQNIKESNDKVIQLLSGSISSEDEARISIGQNSDDTFTPNTPSTSEDGRIIEGVFDGEGMIGPDGKQYSMPANYASKSKLIEGDIMKLTITDSGTFVYKQIGPIDRRRVVGLIHQGENGNFIVVDEETGQKWRVLTASVTYYKGQAGDEAVILVPKNGESKWAAVDNVVRKQE